MDWKGDGVLDEQELQYEMDSLQAHRQASDYGDGGAGREGDSVVSVSLHPVLCPCSCPGPRLRHSRFAPPSISSFLLSPFLSPLLSSLLSSLLSFLLSCRLSSLLSCPLSFFRSCLLSSLLFPLLSFLLPVLPAFRQPPPARVFYAFSIRPPPLPPISASCCRCAFARSRTNARRRRRKRRRKVYSKLTQRRRR